MTAQNRVLSNMARSISKPVYSGLPVGGHSIITLPVGRSRVGGSASEDIGHSVTGTVSGNMDVGPYRKV